MVWIVTLGVVMVCVVGMLQSVGAPVGAASGASTGATRGADNFRTGWYPDQASLAPQVVAGSTFGQLFKATVNGAVYGQPLVDDNQLLVNTESNAAYGLDPVTGTVLWSRQFGSPVRSADIGCGDLAPTMGITSTPVIDTATNTEYLVDYEYVSGTSGPITYFMHALNLDAQGTEQPGFPVQIAGTASNNPSLTFFARHQLQRPGLLFLGGSVYAAFGSHCDIPSWQGWIVGVSGAGHLTTLFATNISGTAPGAGVWMSGGGLVSDGPGQILFATGNGATTLGAIPGTTPPANLGESVVRLAVQPDGTLKATDFFTPVDAATLDQADVDFGSGSPVALPDSYFGTPTIPHLAVAVGKEGYVYLLNRSRLGGEGQGPSGTDAVVGKYGPNGGVWSTPAVWPGNGGWIYIPTAAGSTLPGGTAGQLDAYQYALDGSGNPTLNLAGHSSDQFGFGSSSPVVTSDGTTTGSALLWTIWSPSANGIGAQLRAYNPVPVNGILTPVWSKPIGTASKFNPPGVAGNRIYVGNRDGSVFGFGAPVAAPITAVSPTFPTTVVGQQSTQSVTVTANAPVTVTSVAATGPFTLGSINPPLPVTLATGSSINVPVSFVPTAPGPAGGGLTVTTTLGSSVVTLSGTGASPVPNLVVTTHGIGFGGISPGSTTSSTVGLINDGSGPLTISAVKIPAAPFAVSGLPILPAVLQPGAQMVVTVSFQPTAVGQYSDTLEVDSDGGIQTVALAGTSAAPPQLQITPATQDFGSVSLGKNATQTFTFANVGGTNLTITKSKPPSLGAFVVTTPLAEGTVITPGSSVVASVTYTPTALGTSSDGWSINADDGLGVRTVAFTGMGVIGDPGSKGWKLNGRSLIVTGGALHLTTALALNQAGTAWWPTLVDSNSLTATFTSYIGGGTGGANGTTFMLANASVPSTALGGSGYGLGLAGIPGIAVALDTHKSAGNPSTNFVGITDGAVAGSSPPVLHWLATNTSVPALRANHRVQVTLKSGLLTVAIDGVQVLSLAVTVGPQVRVGFTASTGAQTDIHSVSNVLVTGG